VGVQVCGVGTFTTTMMTYGTAAWPPMGLKSSTTAATLLPAFFVDHSSYTKTTATTCPSLDPPFARVCVHGLDRDLLLDQALNKPLLADAYALCASGCFVR